MNQSLLNAPVPFAGTEVFTLPNGFRVVLKEDHTVPVVSLQAWARCGAVDESPRVYGISHGLEHMVFKGTPTRDAGEITRVIEGHGGYINAATQLESTHYYIDVPSEGLIPALEVLADAVLHPTFPADELERERLVILEEIHMRQDSPDATLWDEFSGTLFEGSPYGIKVIGTEETVSAMTPADLHAYYKAHYGPDNTCLVMAGDFKIPEMLMRIDGLFGKQPKSQRPAGPDFTSRNGLAHQKVIHKNVRMAHFAAGVRVPGLTSDDMIALDVLSDVLGGGASCRFYQHLRERDQVVLSISCDYIPFYHEGIFSIFGETQPAKAEKAQAAVKSEIESLEKNPIRPEELQRAQARLKSEWLHSAETPRGQASTLGSLAVFQRLDLIENYLTYISGLTPSRLMNVYGKYLKGREFSTTLLLPQP